MARRTQTYAIRLAVEGGGQVKAELVTVCQSGTPIRSASCAHGTRCLRSLAARHPPPPSTGTGVVTFLMG
jgi:hypothetical protein